MSGVLETIKGGGSVGDALKKAASTGDGAPKATSPKQAASSGDLLQRNIDAAAKKARAKAMTGSKAPRGKQTARKR